MKVKDLINILENFDEELEVGLWEYGRFGKENWVSISKEDVIIDNDDYGNFVVSLR